MPSSTQRLPLQTGRATLSDVAREADVSLATVDRVLNKRTGVHARSIAQVQQAVERLNYRPDPAAARLARPHPHRVSFLLPSGNNTFIEMLREQIAGSSGWMEDHRVSAQTHQVDVFEPQRLARRILALRGQCDTAVVMALDHPLVQAAIDKLVAQGIAVITLVSDVPKSQRQHFVGIDNVAAGRTAGTLVGRFSGNAKGEVGVIVGSLSLRDHAERSLGFSQVMAAEYPGLRVLPPVEGKDDPKLARQLSARLLAAHPKLVAIYSVGAGNPGISATLKASGRAGKIVFVGHELTPAARADLLDGTMAAVINQDAGHEIRSALRLALSRLTREPVHPDQERIRIDIYLKDNLP
ncbi:LacI family transcriptional regulator [Variovorax boronicumulans]|uniref:LacI family DNA-binding transcriptional regulator n=1 Tax=Variovorax boronicumulans TaxID=436515 RepID=UPI0027803915|nr:LacI family DNA-binding transcriptional regulator [Variovorax boronicumulans]MDQ0035126.1 LacI family transcriptional regulator [Variovorax boronicumulans]MDQ0040660.1 LacI family transcriptional regulator [Variovorax boronicumulans]